MKVAEMFNPLRDVLCNPDFLSLRWAQGEAPFYICPFGPDEQEEMDRAVGGLSRQLTAHGVSNVVIDVFVTMIGCMRNELDDFGWVVANESTKDTGAVLGEIRKNLSIEHCIVPAIRAVLAETPHRVALLKGLGGCHPFLDAKVLMSELSKIEKASPLVVFFPGEYRQVPGSGAALHLLDLPGKGYYRAFDITRYFTVRPAVV